MQVQRDNYTALGDDVEIKLETKHETAQLFVCGDGTNIEIFGDGHCVIMVSGEPTVEASLEQIALLLAQAQGLR